MGAYIVNDFDNGSDWRYSQWVLFIIAAPIVIAVPFMKETSKMRILFLRNKKRGIKVPTQKTSARVVLQKLYTAGRRPIDMMILEASTRFTSSEILNFNSRLYAS